MSDPDIVPDDVAADLFGFVAPTESQLSNISKWASDALALHAEINEVESYLKQLNKDLAQIEEVNLPTAMLAAGTSNFTLTDGGKIEVHDVIQGSLAKDEEKREFALQWVAENNGLELIKRHFEVDYSRDQHERAMVLRKILQENKIHFDEFESIHTGTFKSFLAEKLRDKVMPPFEKMGFRYFKRATIKPGKKDGD